MNSIEPTYGNKVRYKLYSATLSKTIDISDPIGFENDEKELSRDKTYFGIVRKTSDNLKFYQGCNDGRRNTDGGYDFIMQIDDLGINEVLYLIKERKYEGSYKEVYRTEIDLSTLEKSVDNNGVKFCTLKSFEGGFDSLIKARKGEEVELERLETMDGDTISEMPSKTFQLKGRKIYKYSNQSVSSNGGGDERGENWWITEDGKYNFIKTKINASSDTSFESVRNAQASNTFPGTGSSGDMFYNISDGEKYLKITFDFDFDYDLQESSSGKALLVYTIYENGGSYDILENVLIQSLDIPFGSNITKSIVKNIKLLDGQSISVSIVDFGYSGGAFSKYTINKFEIIVEESSVYQKTQCKAYLMRDVFERFTYLITGKENRFKSDFFNQGGIGEYMAITDGGLVRELPNWKLKTKLKDAIDSFIASWNLSVGIETYGYKQYLTIEPLQYFFSNRTVLSLPIKINNVKRTKAVEYIYSGLNIGYDGEGSYENIQGLDKTNGIVNRLTTIKRIENIYERISPYGTDDYEREIPRRLPYSTNPTTDTKYDEKVMILDGKPTNTDVLEQRASSYEIVDKRSDYDDFEEIPSGVFDPEGLTNGRWTPLAMTLRHGWWLRAGLTKYLDKDLLFGSSNGNTGLTGVFKQGADYPYLKGIEYSENSNILASDLQGNLFYPEWIEFEHYVSDEMLDVLEGYEEINRVKCKNFYGLIEFINEDNKLEKGYLFNLKPNGKGKWKLLSYRKLKTNG